MGRPNLHRRARLAALAGGVLVLLSACGGGGGGEGGDSAGSAGSGGADAPNVATSVAPDAAASAAAQEAAASASCGVSGVAAAALERINRLRAAGASCGTRGAYAPAAALRWNDALARAAAAHSLDMATQDYFSHTSADGRSVGDRVSAAGYAYASLGENIAAGQSTVDAVVDAWMHSDGHCANLMGSDYQDFGLACADATTSRYGRYWTLDLARPG